MPRAAPPAAPPACADGSTTRHRGAPGSLQLFKRILCAVDFSDASLKGLEYALALAKEADAELLLMHVIDGLADAKHWQQPTNPSIVEYLQLCERNALARLREVVPKDASTWCSPKEFLMTGKPYDEILRVARNEDVHLIVMGSRIRQRCSSTDV